MTTAVNNYKGTHQASYTDKYGTNPWIASSAVQSMDLMMTAQLSR